HDSTGKVLYQKGDAYALPFPEASFDVVGMMDFLEHVEEPSAIVAEAARVLRPGGLFFFHTFNRNFLSRLIVITGVRWFVANTPAHLHVYRLFIKPEELTKICELHGLQIRELHGTRPVLSSAFWKMLATRRVPKEFAFTFTDSLRVGYSGFAKKGS